VLHGGAEVGLRPVRPWSLPYLRADALARSLHRRVADDGVLVCTLRFRVRGWNGDGASAVEDAQWVLGRLAESHGVPVVLVGHSMGGRTALRVAGDPSVRGVVALAPWLPRDEPMGDLSGRTVVIGHGSLDTVTDPNLSRAYASRAHEVADRVVHRTVPGETHALLGRPRTWNRFVAESVLDILGIREVAS